MCRISCAEVFVNKVQSLTKHIETFPGFDIGYRHHRWSVRVASQLVEQLKS